MLTILSEIKVTFYLHRKAWGNLHSTLCKVMWTSIAPRHRLWLHIFYGKTIEQYYKRAI